MTDQRGKGGFSYLACVSVTVRIIHSRVQGCNYCGRCHGSSLWPYKYNSFCYRFEFLKMRQKLNDFKDMIEFPFFISLVR